MSQSLGNSPDTLRENSRDDAGVRSVLKDGMKDNLEVHMEALSSSIGSFSFDLNDKKQVLKRQTELILATEDRFGGCLDSWLFLGVTVTHFLVNKITKLAKSDSLGHTI